jgi:hypothetical protein
MHRMALHNVCRSTAATDVMAVCKTSCSAAPVQASTCAARCTRTHAWPAAHFALHCCCTRIVLCCAGLIPSSKVQKSKAGTGRVVGFRELGLVNAYTMEASFAGAAVGKYAKQHFNTGGKHILYACNRHVSGYSRTHATCRTCGATSYRRCVSLAFRTTY